MSDNRPIEAIGDRVVSQVVKETWKSGWQRTSAENDDGLDGYIHLRRKGRDTGAVLFAQVKAGGKYRSDTAIRPEYVGINVEDLDQHRERWNRMPLPVILIYVDPSTNAKRPDAWWTDLKNDKSYTVKRKNYILLPKHQRFGEHSKGDFARLCGYRFRDDQLELITLGKEAIYFPLGSALRQKAREFYHDWAISPAADRTNPLLGEVQVSRVGWRHLIRRGRKPAHKWQSWELLPVARAIVQGIQCSWQLGKVRRRPLPDGTEELQDYIGLRAMVEFSHRERCAVQVVLLRIRQVSAQAAHNTSRVWFYSVYELRRGL